MKTARLTFITAYIFLLFILFGAPIVRAADDSDGQFHILFISSYGYSNTAVPAILTGFTDGLKDLNVQISFEFMDSEYFYRSVDLANFQRYLSYKYYSVRDFDLIVAADDQALRFVNNSRESLFKDEPVVFLGVNNLAEAKTSVALPNMTGIAEVVDFENNYMLMKQLFPKRTNLITVVDSSISGQANYVEFMKFKENHPEIPTKIVNTSYYTANGLKEFFSNLGENDIILFLDFSIDGNSDLYTLQNAASFISENAVNVPIFRVASADIAHGVLGGLSYSYYDAGVLAGNMSKDILEGTSPKDIPLFTDVLSSPIFEQGAMDKFGIKYSMLPENVIVINETENLSYFYRNNTILCNLAIIVAILLVLVIALLIISNNRRYKMMRTDYLTKLPNRSYLAEKIAHVVETRSPYGIIMMDVDHFKSINDTKGHQTGDEILAEVSSRLKDISNKNIFFARLGGDEFAAIITNFDPQKADKLCSKIVKRMREPMTTTKGKIKTSVSVGCALFPECTDKIDKVMECADMALYVAKENGRNGYSLFSHNNQT